VHQDDRDDHARCVGQDAQETLHAPSTLLLSKSAPISPSQTATCLARRSTDAFARSNNCRIALLVGWGTFNLVERELHSK
jgi:hypothetical protein